MICLTSSRLASEHEKKGRGTPRIASGSDPIPCTTIPAPCDHGIEFPRPIHDLGLEDADGSYLTTLGTTSSEESCL